MAYKPENKIKQDIDDKNKTKQQQKSEEANTKTGLSCAQPSAHRYVQFRNTNNNLPVNRRRFEGIAGNERICHKCDIGEVGDEYHYLFSCPFFFPQQGKISYLVYTVSVLML